MPTLYIKLLVGFVLFATWIALVFYKVQGADALVAFIQSALGYLLGHAASGRNQKLAAPADQPSN